MVVSLVKSWADRTAALKAETSAGWMANSTVVRLVDKKVERKADQWAVSKVERKAGSLESWTVG